VPFLVKVAGDTSCLSDEEGLDDDDNEDETHLLRRGRLDVESDDRRAFFGCRHTS
jgi:hypothetical protein